MGGSIRPESVAALERNTHIVCLSDTHGYTKLDASGQSIIDIPDGDVLIFAGDICSRGHDIDALRFDAFLAQLPHPHKLVIAGNHDWCFELKGKAHAQALLKSAIYLEDEAVIIEGIKFYGSPWQPEFFNWAFNLPRGEALAKKWRLIPDDTDVLITHGRPLGILDKTDQGEAVGCYDLRQALQRVKPQLHVFGHIHHSYGRETHDSTTYINACICTESYQPLNSAQCFDVTLPT